jgi:hypothetical protein
MKNLPTALRAALLALALATGAATAPLLAQTTAQPTQANYATPDDAVTALIDALKADDKRQLRSILGPGSDDLISSGDPVADSEGAARFVASFTEKHALVADGTDHMTLNVGPNEWPLPIPLVKTDNRWHFDSMAGAQELVNRRIGRNEIAAISAMLAYVTAQQAYHEITGKAGHAEYARRTLSRPGQHDGLYWHAEDNEEPSPLADFVATATAEGYPDDLVSVARTPIHGYIYRILTEQGPQAPGGAKSYIEHGRMVDGFAMVAWPARYGASGIMTFIVNQDGVVFQRDLGPDTAAIAAAMRRYDPDLSWARVDVVGQ